MSIRLVNRDDIPTIINMLLRLGDESPVYGQYTRHPDYVTRNLEQAVTSENFIGLIAEQGLMLSVVCQQWYSPQWECHDMILYVLPEERGNRWALYFISSTERIAKEKGAEYMYLGTSTGIQEERTRSLYMRLGYEEHGGSLRKRL